MSRGITSQIEKFILVYVALFSSFAVLYDVRIFAGFNVLELGGFFFPVILLSYWAMTNFKTATNNYKKIYFLVITWVLLVTVLKMLSYGFVGIRSFSKFFRILNGFSVFIVFPLIFNDQKRIDRLIMAFFIGTFFPLLQGLAQLFLGFEIGGMQTSVSVGGAGPVIYYGLYNKNGGYGWAALCGALIMIYKLGLTRSIISKRGCIYGLFFILYLILASMTLSRTIVIAMTVVSIMLVRAISASNAWFQAIITIFIILAVIVCVAQSDFGDDRYKQIMERSEAELQVISGERDVEFALHGRVGTWKYKLEQFNEKPLIDRLTGTNINIGPHGDYVIWVLQYGYIGIILYMILFFGLLLSSVRTLSRINRLGNSYLRPYGLMVIAGIIVWLILAIVQNSSELPPYSHFIIGNTAIFLSMGKCYNEYPKKQKDYNLYGSYASTLYGAEYCNSNNP